MQYAEVDIDLASSLSITIKVRNRNGKVLKHRRTDPLPNPPNLSAPGSSSSSPPTTPHYSIIRTYQTALLLTEQLLSILLSKSSSQLDWMEGNLFFAISNASSYAPHTKML